VKLALSICTLIALSAPTAEAQVQTRAQQRCIVALNTVAARIAEAEAKLFVLCLKDAGSGKLAAGQTVQSCVAADAKGKVARARTSLAAYGAKRCAEPPSFGPTVVTLDTAFDGIVDMTVVFGADITAVVIDAKADRDGAGCQLAVARGVAAITAAKLKAFNACKSRGLKDGTIVSALGLGSCIGADPSGAVAKAIQKAQQTTQKKCAATPVASAFPGDCADAPLDGLYACLTRPLDCDVCLALRGGDRAAKACHVFANGVATEYCGVRPVTTKTIARQWDETLLEAIRLDTPRPTVHARNLFHLSAVMYDAWLAYGDGTADPFLTHEAPPSNDVAADRDTAISFAAFRLLKRRFQVGPSALVSQGDFVNKLADLGYDPSFESTIGDAPAAVGNRIAAALIQSRLGDGSNEANNYADDTGYVAANLPMIVKGVGTTMANPSRWQPLALDQIFTQNGIPLPGGVQTYVSPNWNNVRPFALTRDDPNDVYVDPGPPPQFGDAAFRDDIVQVIRLSSRLDATDGATMDISPTVRGNNPLGTNNGTGYGLNPVTGQAYPPNVVKRGDWGRALAEFWADGPRSETPPGHWNLVANAVSDDPALEKRVGGTGPIVDDLEWDVKLYFVLNGSVHDAAIAAWGLKRKYDSVRPISAVRYMGGLGQSSDPMGPSYNANGLALEPGLIEVIAPQSSAPGERHESLANFFGEIAVRSWPGQPVDPKTQTSGVKWVRAKTWVPYQRATFVTPAFPGFVSGHSTFSRAAATVLDHFTGSPYFPGGLGEFTIHAGTLIHELGPTADVTFQYASYYDAADEAGQSRLWGGIHVSPDDFNGRIIGAGVGEDAFELATKYFDGTAVP